MAYLTRFSLASLLVFAVACGDDSTSPSDAGPDAIHDGIGVDSLGGEGVIPQDGGGVTTVTCPGEAPPTPSVGTCGITAGSGSAVLLRGTVIAPDKVYENGQVLLQGTKILCVGCDCASETAAATASEVSCPDGVITPALINAHDHLGWSEGTPTAYDAVYDHRHEWRKGKNGKPKITTPANGAGWEGKAWGEIRHLLAGTASVMGAGTANGLLRNLDYSSSTEGLSGYAKAPTFPLGDSSGLLLESGCDYPGVPSQQSIADYKAYVPHVAEGINTAAHNEFLCLSDQQAGGVDGTVPHSTFIHSVGITARDAAEMGASGTGINWSPRSNISLYAMTADVVMLRNLGIKISLGSDWPYSGSINLLRELACANGLNEAQYDNAFSAYDLWRMVTGNAADASGFGAELGRLKSGYIADISIFARKGAATPHEAITRASVKEVALVMRGGIVLYGDAAVVSALGDATCEALDVCGEERRICVESETGLTLAALKGVIVADRAEKNMSPAEPYGLFFCELPPGEPSCVPLRPGLYDGQPTADDSDGDGVANDADSCPNLFNPPRPMNDGKQPDADADEVGDECDPCPLDANTTDCKTAFNPDDVDGDGVNNDNDNCAQVPNEDQADADKDNIGDVCDPCPAVKGTCPFTIKELRNLGLGKQPAKGTAVKVENVVVIGIRTAANSGFAVREGKGDYEALWIYTGDTPADSAGTPLKVGDVVTIEGTFDIFYDIDELKDLTSVTVVQSNGDISPVDIATVDLVPGSASAELLESQLVRVTNATAKVKVAESDAFWVSDNDDACSGTAPACTNINDFFYDGGTVNGQPASTVGQVFSSIIGIVNGFHDAHTLDPRAASDLLTQ
ncbi:MAG: amidohydrolase family protein [Deltaproteobacteria bacterium]|nr:amidohydrolase family protein [Deltaproteobacteria bacterium]